MYGFIVRAPDQTRRQTAHSEREIRYGAIRAYAQQPKRIPSELRTRSEAIARNWR